MNVDDLKAYGARDWKGPARRSEAYWAKRVRTRGAAEGIRIGYELWRQAAAMHPDGPLPASRQRDLSDHVALKEKLGRAAKSWSRQAPGDPVGAAE